MDAGRAAPAATPHPLVRKVHLLACRRWVEAQAVQTVALLQAMQPGMGVAQEAQEAAVAVRTQ